MSRLVIIINLNLKMINAIVKKFINIISARKNFAINIKFPCRNSPLKIEM